jgi:quercetin dioxygenase-like cupin family protein
MIIYGNDIQARACEPGVTRKILAWDKELMMCEIQFEKGAKGSLHAHPHRQITYVAGGSLLFTLNGETRRVFKGDSILIQPNLTHGVEALEDATLIDVFSPCREDFL